MALKYLHSHKIIHKDIKLENIMLSKTDGKYVAKLADFGLAEFVENDQVVASHKSGTDGYLAPEIQEFRPYGPSSDMWSLGCLIFAMLTVALPFPVTLQSKSGSN